VRVRVWPGSTTDQTVITQVKDDLRAWRLGRVVTVADSGFSSEANLAYLTRAGGHYITGVKMREGLAKAAEALARQGRYQHVRDNLRVKEVRLGSDPGRRWSSATTPSRLNATPSAATTSSPRSPRSWSASPPLAPPTPPGQGQGRPRRQAASP
jgi:hypothetical protein